MRSTIRWLSIADTVNRTASERRSPAASQVVRMVRCLRFFTRSSSRTTSAGLSTTGNVCGFFGAGMTASIDHVLCSVTRERTRRAETTMTRVAGVSCFSFVKWSW